LLTFLLFRAAGIGMNVVSLSGLALAFGMSVDGAIVLLQNIARRARRSGPGMPAGDRLPVASVLAASREVLLPLGAATLTTAVVLVPLLYVSGDLRTYYLPFVLAVSASLAASFAVSVTLVPLLARWALPASGSTARERTRSSWLERLYVPLLDRVLARPAIPIGIALLLFAGSLWVFIEKVPRGGFLPSETDTGLRVSMQLPAGTEVARTEALAADFERRALEHPYRARGWIDRVQFFAWDHRAFVEVRFVPQVAMTSIPESLKEEFTALAAAQAGAEINVSGFGPGFSSSRSRSTPSYQLTLRGPDYATLAQLADDVGSRLRREPRVREVDTNASSWLADDAVDLALVPDRDRMARLGLSMRDLVDTTQPALAAELAGRTLRAPDGDVEARVRLMDGDMLSDEGFLHAMARTPGGIAYPMHAALALEERPTPSEINRRQQQYQRHVTFDFRAPRPVGNRFLRSFLRGTQLPPGYVLEDGLDLFLSRREERDVRIALGLALLLVFMVAAALFESLRLPLVAMLAMPLGFTGIAAAFWALHRSFDRAAYVGLIVLAGVSVNGALLLVHRAGTLVRRGQPPRAAMRRAAVERCRPLVLTMVTSTAGLLPLALGGDASASDTWSALALAATSGLLTSTLVALVVVPALFVLVARASARASLVPMSTEVAR
jgi:HAE1 family hydrophobic/amphiphilic exporter-1